MSTQHSGLRPGQKRGIYITVATVVTLVSFFVVMFVLALSRPVVLSDEELKSKGTFLFDNPRSFKEFSLTDYRSEAFTPKSLQGKWSLVFFGFTYCPDVCPTTLAVLNHFYAEQLKGELAEDLQIILVSVDPGRDTPAKLYDYVRFFNRDFIGVTGEFLDLHRFATQLNIPFSKVPGGGENYTVEHGGNIAIINPNGHYVGFFRAPVTVSSLKLGYQSIRATRG